MISNVTNIKFVDEAVKVSLTQYDVGQVLHFEDDFPTGTEVQFDDGSVKVIVNREVSVPDAYLTESGGKHAWIQVIGEDAETTVYRISLIVKAREKKNDYVEPEDENTFREDIQTLVNQNKATVDAAVALASQYKEAAEDAAEEAATSAENAEASANEAAGSADEAEDHAEVSESFAISARTSMTKAQTSEVQAKTYASEAKSYRDEVQTKIASAETIKTQAAQSASQAASSAGSAGASAATAAGAAQAANASAQYASSAAGAAVQAKTDTDQLKSQTQSIATNAANDISLKWSEAVAAVNASKQSAIRDINEKSDAAEASIASGKTQIEQIASEALSQLEDAEISGRVSDLEDDVETINEDITKKIDKPEDAPVVGKVLKVKSVNADGTFVCEWAEGGGSSVDVQINGTSIVQDCVANIPIANGDKKLGLVRIDKRLGIEYNSSFDAISVSFANQNEISSRYSGNKVLIPYYLDDAVKAAMCDGKGAAWSDTEKAAAQQRIGVDESVRQLDALWKLNKGISYDFETDDDAGYQKTVPTGAMSADVQMVGGKSIVFGQELGTLSSSNVGSSGVSNLSFTDNSVKFTHTGANALIHVYNASGGKYSFKANRKYFISAEIKGANTVRVFQINDGSVWVISETKTLTAEFKKYTYILNSVADASTGMNFRIAQLDSSNTADLSEIEVKHVQVFDLTAMFGSGNEPTVEEFEKMFPNDYYPYSANQIVSADVDKVVVSGKNLLDLDSLELSTPSDTSASSDAKRVWNKEGYTYLHAGGYYSTDYLTDISISNGNFSAKANNVGAGLAVVKKLEAGKTYTASYKGADDGRGRISVLSYSSDGTKTVVIASVYAQKSTFTVPSDSDYVAIVFAGCANGHITLYDVQIEEGSTATDYTPYTAPVNHTIPTSLRTLPMRSAGSVYDEIDFVNKKHIQRVGVVDLGTLNYAVIKNDCTVYSADCSTRVKGGANILCSELKPNNSYNSLWALNTFSFAIGRGAFLYTYNGENKICVAVDNDVYTDASEFRTAMNGVMLYYELATPIETDITDIIDSFEVEAGGTITFHQTDDTKHLPVPNTEEYLISLAEVTE